MSNDATTDDDAQTDTLDDRLAAMLSPEGTRYAVICRACRTVWPYQRDCKTVKAARDGRAECPDCGTILDLAVDGGDEA